MSREQRMWFPGAAYHIEANGHSRIPLFQDHKDYAKYIYLLTKQKTKDDFDLHAYSLLPGKVYLLIETFTVEISSFIQRLHTSYAMYFNRRHQTRGHVFNGRFLSMLVTDEAHFLETSRDIHLTPLRANLVTEIADYRWCSARDYLSPQPESDPCHPLLSLERTLNRFPAPKHTAFRSFISHPINC